MRIRGLTTPVIGRAAQTCSVYASIDREERCDDRRDRTACPRRARSPRPPPRRSRTPCTGARGRARRRRRRRARAAPRSGSRRPPGRRGSRRRPSARGGGGRSRSAICEQLRVAAGEHARAEHRVGLDDLELLLGQPPGLEQDRVRDRDLADVVQRRGAADERRPSRSPSPSSRASRAARSPTRCVCSCVLSSRYSAASSEPLQRVELRRPRRRAGARRAWAATTRLELGLARAQRARARRARAAAGGDRAERRRRDEPAGAITGGPASSPNGSSRVAQRGLGAVRRASTAAGGVGGGGARRRPRRRRRSAATSRAERGQPVARAPARRRGPRRRRAPSGPRAHRRRPYWTASWRTRPTTGASARSSPATGSRSGSAAAAWASSTAPSTSTSSAGRRSRSSRPTSRSPRASASASRARRGSPPRSQHPNIVTVYDAGEVDGTLYLAMQYIEGEDLARDAARARAGCGPTARSTSAARSPSALDAAHAMGLIHRDVKPANVLIEGRTAFLTDFGLTKRLDGTHAPAHPRRRRRRDDPLRRARADRGRARSARARDVYSLGCLLYHCLTGQVPFARDTDVAVIYAHLSEDAAEALARAAGAARGPRRRDRQGAGQVARTAASRPAAT